MNGVIILGDLNTCYPLDTITSKSLFPVLGKPMLFWYIEALSDNISTWTILGLDEKVTKNVLKTLKDHYVKKTFTETIPKESDVFILFADQWLHPSDLNTLVSQNSSSVLVSLKPREDSNGAILLERDLPVSYSRIGTGNKVFPLGAITLKGTHLKEIPTEKDTLYTLLFQEVKNLDIITANEKSFALNEPWEFLDLQKELLVKADVKYKVPELEKIPSSTFISSNVSIGKDVTIGENVEIMDTIIADCCKIGDNVRIHGSVLSKNTHVAEDTIVDGGYIDHVHMHDQNGNHVHKDPTFFGIFTAEDTNVEGFYLEPTFITKE